MSVPDASDSTPELERLETVVDNSNDVELDSPEDVTPPYGADSPDPILRRELVPVVGLGGSAGGIQALQEFFRAMPADTGMAFVVILHLLPDQESHLAEILQRTTEMPVIQVKSLVRVEINHVYVIPPNRSLSLSDGNIMLHELEKTEGRRVAIDLFFRSLAKTHGPQSVAIVLSGADGDGVAGLKRIKEAGGVTIAQDPEEAEHDSIPRGAIETGMVDWILPVGEMAARIVGLRENERKIQLPAVQPPEKTPGEPEHEAALRDVLAFLRVRTGHDFTHYKRATVLRRLGRRLQVNGIQDIPTYLAFLRTHPGETGALLQDLLISVTNFFRDPEAFAALREQLPNLLRGKSGSDQVRVWVAGCATGEEAYSLAMYLSEYAASLDNPPSFQIFATDIDEEAIAVARAGVYVPTIAVDVSPERLRRFFVADRGHYRVKKELRDMVLFVSHNLLKDSPFSRLDLVSCRNLLIYFGREAQAQVFGLFHFALRNDGLLFLGGSESADDDNLLFSPLDKKHRLFRKNLVPRLQAPIPMLTLPSAQISVPQLPDFSGLIQATSAAPGGAGRGAIPGGGALERQNLSFSDLHLKLIEEVAPPSVLVNQEYDIVHLSQRAGRYLTFSGGEISINLLAVIHPELRLELRTALFRALQNDEHVETSPVPVSIEGENRLIYLRVSALPSPKTSGEAVQRFLLVIFEEKVEDAPVPAPVPVEPVARRLEQELGHLKDHLSSTIEQYESGTEELKASNEELQAINEELRSATEELETGKEELQSVNEELITVNGELKHKVDEVSRANSDLQNLMGATNIATIFLDRNLRINRYTPSAVHLFHLIPSDLGRPLSDLRHNLLDDHLTRDAHEVIDHLTTLEYEVQTRSEQWFLARLLPYRTLEDRIDGVVLTFIDITERKKAETNAHRSEERFRLLVEGVEEYAIFMLDLDGRPTTWNSGVERVFGYSESEFVGQDPNQLLTPADRAAGGMARNLKITAEKGHFVEEGWALRSDGSQFWAHVAMTSLRDESGSLLGISKIARDMTARREAEEELRRAHDELEVRVQLRTRELEVERRRLQEILEEMPVGVILAEPEEQRITLINTRIRQLFRCRVPEELRLFKSWQAFDANRQPLTSEQFPLARALAGEAVAAEDVYFIGRDGGEEVELMFNVNASPLHDASGQIIAAIVTLQDIAPLRQGEIARQQLMERLVTVQEEERRRISRELHDQMGQQITALLMGLSVPLASANDDDESGRRDAAQMQKLRDITNGLMEQAHRLAWELRPAALDNIGLEAALRQYVTEWGVRSGIETDFVARALGHLPRIPSVETSLYRIVQEALTNVERHAKASKVSVLLERLDDTLATIIEDDGQGFDAVKVGKQNQGHKPSRLGVLGMRERAELVGGTLTIESEPGQGTTIYVRVPLERRNRGRE